MRATGGFVRTTLLLATLAFVPHAAFADTDARWLPWLGCWQSAAERAVSPDARVCFVPTSTGQVERIAIIPLDPSSPIPTGQPLIADNDDHPIVDIDCTGLLRVDWSADGHRYFTTSDRSCIDEVAGRTSAVSLLLPGPAWVEAEVVDTSGRETVRVHRYRRVAVPESLSGRLPADLVARADAAADSASVSRLTVPQIIDASSRVSSHALEAVVLENNAPFLLTVQGLKALSKAHVEESVIDLMVAVSYPDHFKVDQPSNASGAIAGESTAYFGGTMWDQLPAMCSFPFFDPVYCYGSSAFLYYAYQAYGRPYYAPPAVIISPQPPIQPVPVPSVGPARAVNNFGYTHVRESGPTPAPTSSTNTSRPSSASAHRTSPRASSGNAGGGAPSTTSTSSSSGSSSSQSSSAASGGGGGYSSGGGGDTGRTAVPR
jgi:hypothetical protein